METTSTNRSFKLQPIVLAIHLALAGVALAEPAPNELPAGGQVVSGQAVIQQSGARMDIQQNSARVAVDWRTFNIGSQAQVNFQQPDANSVALNRVAAGNASVIEGRLTANGQVFLVNPSGVLFGSGAQVDVGGLVATTMNISNKDFADGNYRFTRDGSTGEVINQGQIRVANGGYVALIAATVRNEGTIQANGGGTVALAAGDGARLEFGDGRLMNIKVDPSTIKTLIENKQLVQAQDGRVLMTAVAASKLQGAVINNAGAVEANSITAEGGVIQLTGSDEISNTGTLDASGKTAGGMVEIDAGSKVSQAGTIKADASEGKGGRVVLTGEHLQLDDGSLTTATGASGGGEIYAGGGKQGKSLEIGKAKKLSVAVNATLDASATIKGNGGTIMGISSDETYIGGVIKAEGGLTGGDGGFVETSGRKVRINSQAMVSTMANLGKTGEWLLDPDDYIIASSGGNETGAQLAQRLGSSNITIQTTASGVGGSGDIVVSDPVAWSNANSLSLSAYHNVSVNQTITNTGTGGVSLQADNGGLCVAGAGNCGTVNFAGVGHVTVSGGLASIFYNPAGSNGTADGNGNIVNAYKTPTNYSSNITLNNGSLLTASMLVNDVNQLQSINTNLTATYALGKDINASATTAWNGGAGFSPIGSGTTTATSFVGNFDGLGHTIDQLYINRPSTGNVGLFGTLGRNDNFGPNAILTNVGLTNANVTGGNVTGALVGRLLAYANVSNNFSEGKVTGGITVGGLVGINSSSNGNFSRLFSTADVKGLNFVGGLVGVNSDILAQSYSHGSVQGTLNVGGLAGYASGRIEQSYSTGAVTGTTNVGGLVGLVDSHSEINSSYSMGAVKGSQNVGGLVGTVGSSNANIHDSYSTGFVTGVSSVGGLIGAVQGNNTTVNYSYWNADTAGKDSSKNPLPAIGSFVISSPPVLTGVKGLTTYEMMNSNNSSPSSPFSPKIEASSPFYVNWNTSTWGVPADGVHYPYLNWRFSTVPQVISGTLLGQANSGQTIKAAKQGQLLDYFTSTYRNQPQSSTGYNGFYYFAENSNTIPNGTALLAYQSAVTPDPLSRTGDVQTSNGGNLTKLDLTPNLLSVASNPNVSGRNDYVGSSEDLVIARGEKPLTGTDPLADAPYTVSGANIIVNNNVIFQTSGLDNFDLSDNITTNNTHQTYNSAITLTGNATLTSGSGIISFGQSSLGNSVTGAYSLSLNTTSNFTQTGSIPNASGALRISGLELLGNGTSYTLTNLANEIGTLGGNTGSVDIRNNASLSVGSVGSSTGLTVSEAVTLKTIGNDHNIQINQAITALGAVFAQTGSNDGDSSGNIILNSSITSNATNDAVVLASRGNFTNNFGATAINLTNSGSRWLVYSTNPALDIRGGLLNNMKQYAATLGTPLQDTRSGFVYTVAPQVANLRGLVIKTYDGDSKAYLTDDNIPQPVNNALNYLDPVPIGSIDNDIVKYTPTQVDPITGLYLGSYDTRNVGINKTVTAPVTVNSVDSKGNPVYGYLNSINGTIGVINPAILTYTSEPRQRLYGDANPTFAGTVTGFVATDTESNATTGIKTFASSAVQSSNVGSYSIDGSGLAANYGNYIFVQATNNANALTINPAKLTYFSDPQQRMYGDANPTFTGTVSGFKLSDTESNATSGSKTFASPATPLSNIGQYAVNGGGLIANYGNYTFDQAAENAIALTVNPRAITLTAGSNGLGNRFYGQTTNPVVSYSVGGSGMANGEDAQTLLNFTIGSAANSSTGAGVYQPLDANAYKVGGISVGIHGNYSVTQINDGTLTINPAKLFVTANSLNKTYDGLPYAGGNGVSYDGFVNNENSSVLNGTLSYSGTSQGAKNVGSYVIAPSGQSASNYVLSYIDGTLSINPAMLTYEADFSQRVYGDANPVFTGTVTGFKFTDTESNATTGTKTFASPSDPSTNVGQYAINGSGLVANFGNYIFDQLATNATALTVNTRDITLTAGSNAPGTRIYGDSVNPAPVPLYTVGGLGMANGENAQSLLNFTVGSTATPNTVVGTFLPGTVNAYKIGNTSVGVHGNYNVTALNDGTLTIDQAKLTVSANSQNITYNGLSYLGGNGVVYSGFVLGENSSVLNGSLSYTGSSQGAKNVGNYLITPTGQTAQNYNISYVSSNLVIDPANLSITANNQIKTYDGLLNQGANGVTYNGFVPGDDKSVLLGTLTYTGSSQGARNVGNYLITPSGQTAINYSINYGSGQLTVNPADLNLFAVPDSKIHDGSSLSSKIPFSVGLQTGDLLSPLSQSFDSQDVGRRVLNVNLGYTISDGNGGNNYLVDYHNAEGAIIPQPLPVYGIFTAQEIEPKYGLRYTISPSGNTAVTGEAVADVGGEQDGNGGKENGSLRLLANLVFQSLGQPISQWDFRSVGPQRIIRHLIVRSSNPLRTLKYSREYGFDPLNVNAKATEYDLVAELNKEPAKIKLDIAKIAEGITTSADIDKWTFKDSIPGVFQLTRMNQGKTITDIKP